MRLYLDIDGVLTAHPESVPGIETFTVRDYNPGGDSAYVDWRPDEFYELVDLFDEVVWATTWILSPGSLDALEHKISVKFPRVDLTYEEYVREKTRNSCGKRLAVMRHWEADPAPFVWIDDHIGSRDKAWARSVAGKTLVPSYNHGGVYAMMGKVEELAR